LRLRLVIRPRCTVLGHIQRGGTPTAFDRVLSSRFGLEAITAVHEGDFGKMMALHGTKIARVPLASATDVLKTVPIERYENHFLLRIISLRDCP
jgi:6-phosphofructokinase 1